MSILYFKTFALWDAWLFSDLSFLSCFYCIFLFIIIVENYFNITTSLCTSTYYLYIYTYKQFKSNILTTLSSACKQWSSFKFPDIPHMSRVFNFRFTYKYMWLHCSVVNCIFYFVNFIFLLIFCKLLDM